MPKLQALTTVSQNFALVPLHLKAITSAWVLTVVNIYVDVVMLNDCNLQPAPVGEGSVQNQWWK